MHITGYDHLRLLELITVITGEKYKLWSFQLYVCISSQKVTSGGLGDRDLIPGRGKNFSLHCHFKIGSGDHPTYCTMAIGGSTSLPKK